MVMVSVMKRLGSIVDGEGVMLIEVEGISWPVLSWRTVAAVASIGRDWVLLETKRRKEDEGVVPCVPDNRSVSEAPTGCGASPEEPRVNRAIGTNATITRARILGIIRSSEIDFLVTT